MPVELRTVAAMIVFILSYGRLPRRRRSRRLPARSPSSRGGVIAGAEVAATNVDTSIATKTTTNSDGVYTVTQLREGPYMLSITAPGLREFIVTNILLVTRDVRRIDAKLEVGVLSEAVEVTGGATLIEAETPRISDVRTADQLRTLPLNDRGVWSFLQVTPMLSPRGGSYSFAGSRTNQSQFAIDGTTMSDGVTDNAIGPLANYIESFKEVKLDLANNSAEYPAFGQVTIISKSGTNAFNGSVFDYYQSPIFRARDPFQASAAGGCTTSGCRWRTGEDSPALRRPARTFWFASGETFTGSSAPLALNPTVPLEPGAAAIFRRSASDSQPVHRRDLHRRTHSGECDQSGLAAIQDRFYPLPNTGNTSRPADANNYPRYGATGSAKPYYATSRLDHNFSASDRYSRASRCTSRRIRCGKAICRRSASAGSSARTRR